MITHHRTGRALQLARFIAALGWSASSRLLSASSARGLTNRFDLDSIRPLLSALFFLFLLGVGFSLLEMIARRPTTVSFVLGLPKRSTRGREWLIGAALGWGMVVLAVLPLVLTGNLHVTFSAGPGTLRLLILNLLTLGALSLAVELVFRGYPFRCLIEVIGPTAATMVMALIFGLSQVFLHGANRREIFIAVLMAVLFSVAWFRTHGLWLAWGMRFGWVVSMGVLFGLSVSGNIDSSILVQASTSGRRWMNGGDYGPEGAWLTVVVILIGLLVLVRVTRDYAWHYTHPPIVAGGYPMEAQPPAAHTAMEQAQQNRPPALVQILPSSPEGRSAEETPKS